jgi:RNA polymerase sigma-70 factor (ECF subfamily)
MGAENTKPGEQKKKRESASQKYVDEATLALLKERNAEFLGRLFSEVNPYLSRICLANGIYSEDVSELIHQTWESFFLNVERFEARSQIRTFICGILFNTIREYRRNQKRFVSEENPEKILDHAFTLEGWWKVEPADPFRLFELKEATDFVRECFDGLTQQQMTAFVMREVEEEKSEDICNVLGVNASHLRVLLFRAKDKLRKCLEGKVNAERA